MNISIGDNLPEKELRFLEENGPQTLNTAELSKGKTILIFGVPGAFTPTCSQSHLPGYIEHADEFLNSGIDAIYCVCVNDIFVAKAWETTIGADKKNIQVLCDGDGSFTKALGLDFDAPPPTGFFGRSKRYAMIVKNGEIIALEVEENPGVCELSSASTMLERLNALSV